MEKFDVIVIGGGPGGYLCAERVAAAGKSVALFEKENLGGTCLNHGCIPTKTLLNSAKLYRHATESGVFGVTSGNVSFDHAAVVARKAKVVDTLVSGVASALNSYKVTVIKEQAEIQGRENGAFKVVSASGEAYFGSRLVIASGSETTIPPVPGLKEGLASGFVVTNRELLALTELPREMAVIGGGVIGLEMACYLASVGVKITIIEMLPKIAGSTDEAICSLLMEEYGKRGMEFKLSCKVLRVEENTVVYEEDGQEKPLPCDKVLLSAGRRAVSAGLGLESIGVKTERGAIVTDKHMCTNVANVYAVGDCNGKIMLAHTAYREAEVAANHINGVKDAMDYSVIPSVIYTDPEVASVGETKKSAEEKGLKVKELTMPMAYSGRYIAESENGSCFAKVVYDKENQRILGVHMVGPYVSESILAAEMMISTQLPPQQLQKLVFPHPTVLETVREALFKL